MSMVWTRIEKEKESRRNLTNANVYLHSQLNKQRQTESLPAENDDSSKISFATCVIIVDGKHMRIEREEGRRAHLISSEEFSSNW